MAVYEYDSQNDKLNRIAGGTLYADCPIGSYIPFGGTAIPTGWLLCNGQAVSRTDYADLFAVIGTAYGSGDGSTTFNIPDLREAVPKGAGLTSKSNNHLDADGLAVGEFLDDRIQNHEHIVRTGELNGLIKFISNSVGGNTLGTLATSEQAEVKAKEINAGRTGATTEVKSVGSNYIIKAKQIGVPADFASAISNAFKLSPIETVNITTSNQTAQYDGYLFIYVLGDTETNIIINDEVLVIAQVPSSYDNSLTIPICKGDTFKVNNISSVYWCKARWYKQR